MAPLIFLLLAGAAWLIWTGRLARMTGKDFAMLALGIVGIVLASKGRIWFGGAGMLIAGLYAGHRLGIGVPRRPVPPPEPADVEQARAVLGLPPDYDEAAIRDAHRRLMARVHPDVGGTDALAGEINRARDILLRHHFTRNR